MPNDDDYGFWDDERDRSHVPGHTVIDRPTVRKHSAPTRRPSGMTVRRADVARRTQRTRRVKQANVPGQPNPLVRRLGALCAISLVAVPIAFIFRGSDNDATIRTAEAEAQASAGTLPLAALQPAYEAADAALVVPSSAAAAVADTAALPVVESVAVQPSVVETVAATAPATTPSIESLVSVASTGSSSAVVPSAAGRSALAAGQAVAAEQTCSQSYQVQPGDYWISIAKRSNVKLTVLLSANSASVTTPIYPGRTICLPAGAQVPTPTTADAPDPTAATTPSASHSTVPATTPATTRPPATTTATTSTPTSTKPKNKAPATTAPPTTAAPTTAAPTTTEGRPANNYSRAQVEAIIRAVWPDDLEDEAVRIATRESNLNPTVRNACCYGLFQIYYTANRASLNAWGITSPSALYDPEVNAFAAYAMYLRAGGWGPWAL